MNEVDLAVREIIAGHIQADPATVALEARLEDLKITSLDVVEIVFALEQRFNVQIPIDSADNDLKFDTVGDVARAVGALTRRPA